MESSLYELCNRIDSLDEDEIIREIQEASQEYRRRIVSALLYCGYLIDNYSMTGAREYPYLPGIKGNTTLARLNNTIREILHIS